MSAPIDSLARFLTRRVDEGWSPGASWAVDGPDGVISRGAVGQAAVRPQARPVAADTPYDLASLTKPLCTAPLLLLFAEEGRLDIDAPVVEVLDELRGAACSKASLLELATHRAGLPAWRPLAATGGDREGILRSIAGEPEAVARGTELYSDLGYILLGFVLERVAGRSLDRLFDERIAGPVGLEAIGFAGSHGRFDAAAATECGNMYERSLAGAEAADFAWRTEIPPGQVHDANAHALGGVAGHAGLFGTVEDVTRLARALGEHSPIRLGEGARRRLLSAPRDRTRTVGMVQASASAAARALLPAEAPGHTGFTGTSLWIDPGAGRTYVLLANRVHPTVPVRSFQWLRRGFHRIAAALD